MDSRKMSKPVSLKNVKVTDAFWHREIELVRTEVIPYQWNAINDRVKDAPPSGSVRNFEVAARLAEKRRKEGKGYVPEHRPVVPVILPEIPENFGDQFYGLPFQDTDLYKWLEAVSYSLAQHADSELERTADEVIETICAAQMEDGYLDTFYIINDIDAIFTNLQDHHELYCFGHLTEAAVAYFQATGKGRLLHAAKRYAEYIMAHLGPEAGKKKGYPGHEIAEMALARLYELTGEEKYLKLGQYFLDQRGVRPYYFDSEHSDMVIPGWEGERRLMYYQSHLPVRMQDEAVGHAVRAVYLYSGMADIARLTEDESLLEACERLWDSIINKKMYITGGIGAQHMGESFSYNYDLPNDTAYAETCASVGLVFFARRMLEIRADSRYADVMERALFNGVISGMALDGKSFFYVNPLECQPNACREDPRKAHVAPVRQKWHVCACCPPNLARLVSSVASYAYTASADVFYVHLYMGGIVEEVFGGREVTFSVTSGFPWDGGVRIEIHTKDSAEFTLALRIPGWCEEYTVNGVSGPPDGCFVENGYLLLHRMFRDGDVLTMNFAMQVRFIEADYRVREDIGRVAVTRGPIVYCLEEADNGTQLHRFRLPEKPEAETEERCIGGVSMTGIKTPALRMVSPGQETGLYHEYQAPHYEETVLHWIPYFAWANRGEGEMQVFIRV